MGAMGLYRERFIAPMGRSCKTGAWRSGQASNLRTLRSATMNFSISSWVL